jgi:hypothetical protein
VIVNSGEFVIAAAVVVEKLERRSAVVGTRKESRRPRMSEFVWVTDCRAGRPPRGGASSDGRSNAKDGQTDRFAKGTKGVDGDRVDEWTSH